MEIRTRSARNLQNIAARAIRFSAKTIIKGIKIFRGIFAKLKLRLWGESVEILSASSNLDSRSVGLENGDTIVEIKSFIYEKPCLLEIKEEKDSKCFDSGQSYVKIYQVFFRTDQLSQLDPDFIPYDWCHNPYPEFCETLHFLNFYNLKRYLEADYVGIVSHKFGQKTNIAGKQFISFILNNPGYDVYFINPFPYNVYTWHNIWDHGEACHKGIKRLTQNLFDKAGYGIDISKLGRQGAETLLFCNYWVGSARFWEIYMEFVTPLFELITQKMDETERQRYFARTSYLEYKFPFFPFIFERLFSTLLSTRQDILSCPFLYTKRGILKQCQARIRTGLSC